MERTADGTHQSHAACHVCVQCGLHNRTDSRACTQCGGERFRAQVAEQGRTNSSSLGLTRTQMYEEEDGRASAGDYALLVAPALALCCIAVGWRLTTEVYGIVDRSSMRSLLEHAARSLLLGCLLVVPLFLTLFVEYTIPGRRSYPRQLRLRTVVILLPLTGSVWLAALALWGFLDWTAGTATPAVPPRIAITWPLCMSVLSGSVGLLLFRIFTSSAKTGSRKT